MLRIMLYLFSEHDTVGVIGIDAAGNIAAGVSTSGWAFCNPGRCVFLLSVESSLRRMFLHMRSRVHASVHRKCEVIGFGDIDYCPPDPC